MDETAWLMFVLGFAGGFLLCLRTLVHRAIKIAREAIANERKAIATTERAVEDLKRFRVILDGLYPELKKPDPNSRIN